MLHPLSTICASNLVSLPYGYHFIIFFLKFLADTHILFGAASTPVLDFWWHLIWVSKPEWVLPYSLFFAEVYVMYIPWDPPLVLHIADLLTDSIAGRRPGSYLAQGYYCVAAVGLEPAINRSWVPRANHSATRPGHILFTTFDYSKN